MSDLEDYAYSPYDDLEDILYDADPAPELADDLAEHALHSPVYLDEIAGYELQEYHSDWEYYSDDYMDDDPALEHRDLIEHQTSRKRGKKRKLVETKDIPALDLNETKLITRSIKGTVWAKPGRTEPPTHTVGQGDRISLMKNWRQVFSIKDGGWGRRTDATDNDESWAKDLGLADMGLQPQRQKSFEQEPVQQDDDYDEEDSIPENEDEDSDVNEDVEDVNSVVSMRLSPKGEDNVIINNSETNGGSGSGGGDDQASSASSRTRRSAVTQAVDAETIDSLVASEDESPRKRRRLKQGLQSPQDSTDTVPKQANDGSLKPTDKQQGHGNSKTKPAGDGGWTTTKKRKASEDPYLEHDDDPVINEARRAKRLAAGNTNGDTANKTSERRSRPTRARTQA